jgi:predicted Zn-dependent peptidase
MKLKLLLVPCLLMLGMSAEAKDYKYYSVANDPMHTRIYTLDNGLKVYLSVNKEKPRIQTYIAVRTGSRNDPPTTTGLAHYLEHLMFKGTKLFGTSDLTKEAPLLDSIQNRFEVYRTIKDPAKRKAYYHGIDSLSQVAAKYNIPNEYDKLMSSIGSEGSNAYTSNDVTCYVEDIPSNEVDNWAKIQADRFQNMVIRGFHTELEAVYEEFNIGLANDGEKEWDALNAKLYPNHPYGTQTTIGTQEHLKNPSIVNIKNYFNRYYVPNNVAICMSGDLDPEAVIATIDKYFSSWKPNANLSYPQYAPVRNLTAPVDTSVVGKEAENIIMAWKFDKAASFQADTLDVISKMLYNGKAGLMDLDLDQKMQWLGGGAFADNLAEYSSFLVEGTPKEGQSLDDLRKLILGEISKLKAGNFSDDLLPSVINNMKKNYYQSLESNQSRASLYVDAFINGQKWDDAVNRLNRISGITKKTGG